MYPPRLIEHFENPRNVGELAPPAVTVEVSNPACGVPVPTWANSRRGG